MVLWIRFVNKLLLRHRAVNLGADASANRAALSWAGAGHARIRFTAIRPTTLPFRFSMISDAARWSAGLAERAASCHGRDFSPETRAAATAGERKRQRHDQFTFVCFPFLLFCGRWTALTAAEPRVTQPNGV